MQFTQKHGALTPRLRSSRYSRRTTRSRSEHRRGNGAPAAPGRRLPQREDLSGVQVDVDEEEGTSHDGDPEVIHR
jgi:hypothetical protein